MSQRHIHWHIRRHVGTLHTYCNNTPRSHHRNTTSQPPVPVGLLCLVDMVAALNLDPLWHDSEELKIAPYDTHHNQHRNHQRQAGRSSSSNTAMLQIDRFTANLILGRLRGFCVDVVLVIIIFVASNQNQMSNNIAL